MPGKSCWFIKDLKLLGLAPAKYFNEAGGVKRVQDCPARAAQREREGLGDPYSGFNLSPTAYVALGNPFCIFKGNKYFLLFRKWTSGGKDVSYQELRV
uniref:Uncharacterized protein n=1 Tax=Dromaius novaehollandiae TaxID=8790 RepID=A0A8C4K3W1_DRONO